jgi:prephenate dehydrogenase
MSTQVTIIGLGQIGASLGLALSEHKDEMKRVGHDLDIVIARQAEKLGAIDRVAVNIPSAVEKSKVVLLSLPSDQVLETLELIAPYLPEGCVVLDTAPIKQAVFVWVQELLPPERFYVGLIPVINPVYLDDDKTGQEAARADLFQNGLMAIAAPPSTHPDALQLASDLTRLIGASPLFVDPVEIDGLMASTHNLPQLLASALVNSTVNNPGWRDGRKIAGRAFAQSTKLTAYLDNAGSLSEAAVSNPENTIRVLEGAIASIRSYITDIENSDRASLEARLEAAQKGRQQWWAERQSSDWLSMDGIPKVEYPTPMSIFGRLLGRGRKSKSEK